ncbi:MAG: hypothetical protein U1B84_08505 [Variovorax sp.]|nr:hypothetical protein [Variovorax sp.]
MPSQQAIERFTLAFHRQAVVRLREHDELREQALSVIDRWEAGGMSTSSRRYRDEWRSLLRGDPAQLERAICSTSEHAATLRSMSPLGFVLTPAERMHIRQEAMAA